MKYLGIAKNEKGHFIMPDRFVNSQKNVNYEAVEIDDTILLIPEPLNKKRFSLIEKLAKQSIEDHKKTLEGLAR